MSMISGTNFLGSKGNPGLYQFIISKMPKHDVYIECFGGTGVIASKKKLAKINYIIELDKSLCYDLEDKLLPRFTVLNSDVFDTLPDLIRMHNNKKVCIYLDPPYLPETRSCYHSHKYSYELSFDDHIKLLDFMNFYANEKNVYILLSGYYSELYMSMLEVFNFFKFSTIDRGGNKRLEYLWTNFDPDIYIKHTYDYVGRDFVDRQRIKRKVKRWSNKFKKLSLDEKHLIYNALEDIYNASK